MSHKVSRNPAPATGAHWLAIVVLATCLGLGVGAPVPTRAAGPAGQPQQATRRSPVDGMEQVYVPAGAFRMGSDTDPAAGQDERPRHEVWIDGYWLDRAGRRDLPALRAHQAFGRARGAEVLAAIRDSGTFMDPRSRKDWWR